MESLIASVFVADATRIYDKEYSYFVPEIMHADIKIGMRVSVPFGSGNSLREAMVYRLFEKEEAEYGSLSGVKLKQIAKLLDGDPILDPFMLEFALWIKDRYICTFYDAIRCLLPSPSHINSKYVKAACLAMPAGNIIELINSESLDRIQYVKVLEILLENEFTVVQDIKRYTGVSDSLLNTLKKRGYIDIVRVEVKRDPFARIENKPTVPPVPTDEQDRAIKAITHETGKGAFVEFLLHGVTGSGKTEVYLCAIKHALDLGLQSIVLVPEISLTPQTVDRFRSRFGEQVALLHSRLSPGERYDQWRLIKSGARNVVIGPRSAVFAPVDNLGLIIIDEEHDGAYKSEVTPKYHAREIARERCKRQGAVLVLGSATPSVETYYHAKEIKTKLLKLNERPNNSQLPSVELVDMREELSSGNRSIFSRRLSDEIDRNIKVASQTMLMLNRRGHSSFILCRRCGHVAKCRHCNVSLTVHMSVKTGDRLICHYCGFTSGIPVKCPSCGSVNIRQFGAGTQKVEEEVLKSFPAASVIRMDMDTTSGKNAHDELLSRFRRDNINIMVGTQMIAKGHDFPNVTLVGVLAADSILNIPDFRASERTFQLLTQVAGRAGRGANPGRVVIQSYNMEDYSINAACRQDYEQFYSQEINIRKQLDYPPFTNIAALAINSADDGLAGEYAMKIKEKISQVFKGYQEKYELMGPGRSPISKLNGRFRWRVIVKCGDMDKLINAMQETAGFISKTAGKNGASAVIDLNPYDML